MKTKKKSVKKVKKEIEIPEIAVGEIATLFGRDSQTVKRWFKAKKPIITSDPVKEILKKHNI